MTPSTIIPTHGQTVIIRAKCLAMEPEPDAPLVLIENGLIKALGNAAGYAAKSTEAPLVDLSDYYLSPAPLDAHVHLWLQGNALKNLRKYKEHQIVGVRDLGHPVRRHTPRNLDEAPPLVAASGPGICTDKEGSSWLAQPVKGVDQAAAAAKNRIAEGAKVIKLFASGLLDFDTPGQVLNPLALSEAEIKAAVKEAKQAGLPVSVHASGNQAVRTAVDSGVTSVEHGFFLDRACFKAMSQKMVSWVPTLAAVITHAEDREGRHPPKIKRNLRWICESQAQDMRMAHEMGVNLVMGSDAGSYGLPHGQALFMEAASWLQANIPAPTVFKAMTCRAANLLGFGGELGNIRPGARAWLLAVSEDPRKNPMTLAEPVWSSFNYNDILG